MNLENVRGVALVAGFAFLSLAAFTQGVLPMLEPQSRSNRVTAVVRTDLGELKWMVSASTDYTDVEQRGRAVYIREGCWYCHSQFVRPVTGETRRWGPVSQAGEYAFDVPHLFSTRRIGPDLSRVGLKYSDEWHLAHFWNPRMVVPDSIMPRYAGLFEAPREPVRVVQDAAGDRTLERNAVTERFFNFDSQDKLSLTPSGDGLLFVPARGKKPVIFTPNEEFSGDAVRLAVITEELTGLVAYLQKLGTSRGKWRDTFEPQRFEAVQVSVPRSDEWIEYGKQVYQRRCEGCHGVKGDGNGPAATFMHIQRPRDFTLGQFKFKTTPTGIPTDGDLLRTITRGVRGTAMPTWHELHGNDRLAVIQYIKYELAVDRTSDPAKPYAFFVEETAKPPIHIEAPPPSPVLVNRGREVWQQAKCWECHGQAGKGDGEKAPGLKDESKFPIRPADLTLGQFKSGPTVEDIFRTMSTGLTGTPMPSYRDSLPEADRWALSYYVLALSAFIDPLTGKRLQVSAEDRTALNDPSVKAPSSRFAYAPKGGDDRSGTRLAGEAWAARHGIELSPAATASGQTAAADPP
jgi:cytochrome c oxidase cbb3-type subunit I/II